MVVYKAKFQARNEFMITVSNGRRNVFLPY